MKNYSPKGIDYTTELTYLRGIRNSGRPLTVGFIFRKINGLKVPGNGAWKRKLPIRLQSFDPLTGRVFFNPIRQVLPVEAARCVVLSLSTGEILRLTPSSLVLTPNGFVAADNLSVSDKVVCRGSMKARHTPSARTEKKERAIVEGLKYYSSGWVKRVRNGDKVYVYQRQHRARLVVEAQMNKLTYEAYLKALKTDPLAVHLLTLPSEVDVHHKNEDAMDDRRDNLEVLTVAEHQRRHDVITRFSVDYTVEAAVVGQSDEQLNLAYAVEMAEATNFCTRGGAFVSLV